MIAEAGTGTGGSGLVGDVVLLERLADAEAAGDQGLGVSALALIAGRDKSQVSRALVRLAHAGLVERNAVTRRYRIGPRIFSLAARTSSGRLVSAAEEPMRDLAADLGETVHLCVLEGPELVTLRTESPGHGYRGSGWVGSRVPAHGTSAGRALLIDATRPELERRFDGVRFVATGPRARVRDVGSLVEVVAEARSAGYAAVDEEFEAAVAGVSAPIRDFRGAIVAALNVSAPADRLRPRLADAGSRTRVAAEAVSQELGWAPRGGALVAPAGPS